MKRNKIRSVILTRNEESKRIGALKEIRSNMDRSFAALRMTHERVDMNRKEFLKTLARYGLLALIVFLGVFLITNRKTTVEEECDNNFECRNCNKRDNCKIEKK